VLWFSLQNFWFLIWIHNWIQGHVCTQFCLLLARLQGRQWNEATSSFWLTKLIRNISEEGIRTLYIILQLFSVFCIAETLCEIEPNAPSRSQLFITNESLRTESLQYNSFTGPRIKSCWGGGGGEIFDPVQNGLAHPAFCKNENRISSPEMKRSGRDASHPPPPNADFEERVELYFYSTAWSSWRVLGWALPFHLQLFILISPVEIFNTTLAPLSFCNVFLKPNFSFSLNFILIHPQVFSTCNSFTKYFKIEFLLLGKYILALGFFLWRVKFSDCSDGHKKHARDAEKETQCYFYV